MDTIKLDYSAVERVSGFDNYYTVHNDPMGLYSIFKPTAFPVVLPGVDGDFFAFNDYDEETDKPLTVINEAVTGAKICVGNNFRDAYYEAIRLFTEHGPSGFNKQLHDLIQEGFVSPRYKIRKEVNHE